MSMTVITISNAPRSLRGDLTKWMQEIDTGVYVGDLNSRIRDEIWKRVTQSVGKGRATICYAATNELGYQFRTHRTAQLNVSYDGIPLVMLPIKENHNKGQLQHGFSNQAKLRQARRFAGEKAGEVSVAPYVVVDIETTGLDPLRDKIIEIGAIKVETNNLEEFSHLVLSSCALPNEIVELTGITNTILAENGRDISQVLDDFIDFIGELPIVGYNLNFDINFINASLRKLNKGILRNQKIDLMGLVKKEKIFLKSYKLDEVLLAYGIDGAVSHRASEDARLAYVLTTKVNGFTKQLNRKR